jgi:hypothetical protein
MATNRHAILEAAERHPPYRKIFADDAARTGDSDEYTSDDLYATAYQVDTQQVYVLTAIDPVWTPIAGGSGGTDTWLVPSEYYVDPDLSADDTLRQYPTIAAALAAASVAGTDPTYIRLADGKTHAWDGSGLITDTSISIYGMDGAILGAPIISLSDPTSMSMDGRLSFTNVRFDIGFSTISVAVQNLYFTKCNGSFVANLLPTPNGNNINIVLNESTMSDYAIVAGSTFNNDDDVTMIIERSNIVTTFPILTWAPDIGDSFTTDFDVTIASSVIEFSDDLSDTIFVDTPNRAIVNFRDSKLIINASFNPVNIKTRGTSDLNWEACQIIEGVLGKSGGGYLFGASGSQAGLEIQVSDAESLPYDAPLRTVARSAFEGTGSGRAFGFLTFTDSEQWRAANDTVHLGGVTIIDPAVLTPIPTAADGDFVVNLDPASTQSMFTVKGRITADNNTAGESAVWDVDSVIRGDASPDQIDFLAGSAATIVYEDSGGQFTPLISMGALFRVVDTPVVGSITINGNSLTAVAGARTPGSDDFNGSLGVAEAIVAVDNAGFNNEFEIAGDFTDDLTAGSIITISGSTANDGSYTVDFSFFSGGNTVIGVVEDIPDATVDGAIDFDAPRSIVAEMVAAINDAANSFVGVCIARQSTFDMTKLNIISTTTGALSISESGSDITIEGLGVCYSVTRNSGSTNTRLRGDVRIHDARLFI